MKDRARSENSPEKPNFKIVSESNGDVSSIDSTNLVSQLSSLYYKTALIKSVATFLNQGISPEKLLISPQSLLSTKDIRGVKSVDWVKNAEILYNTGYLQGAFPDERTVVFKIVADCFRDMNGILHQNGHKKMFSRFLEKVFSVCLNNGFDDGLTCLDKIAFDKIQGKDNLTMILFNSARENCQNKYDKYMSDKEDLAKLIPLLRGKERCKFNLIQNKLISQYINPFFGSLENKSYPLVFLNNEGVLNLMCHGHFSKNLSKDADVIDIRSFSHNSPLEILFNAGASIAGLLYCYYKLRCQYLDMKEKEFNVKKMADEAARTKREKKEYEQLKGEYAKAEKNKNQYEAYFNDCLLKEIAKIDSHFYKQKMQEMSDSILKNYNRLLIDMNIRIYKK